MRHPHTLRCNRSFLQVGQAAPVLVAQATGSDKRSTISQEYGGLGDESAIAVPIYRAIGQVGCPNARNTSTYPETKSRSELLGDCWHQLQAAMQVITISGRTIKKEAQASPSLAEDAIGKIDDLLNMLPKSEIESAQQLRQSRRNLGLEIKRTDVPASALA